MMRCFLFCLFSLVVLATSSLAAQSNVLEQRIRSILNGHHDREQLNNLNVALIEMINEGMTISDTLFDQVIAMAEDLDAPVLVSNIYSNRSIYDMNAGDLAKGLAHAEKAIEAAQSVNNESFEANAYNMKLRIMMTGGKIKGAADLASGLVKKYHLRKDTINEAQTYMLLSRLSTSLENYPMTLVYDSIAINLLPETSGTFKSSKKSTKPERRRLKFGCKKKNWSPNKHNFTSR